MTSFADPVAALLALVLVAEPVAPPPADFAAAVTDKIAAEWRVDPADLRIEWGHVPELPAGNVPVKLVGGNAGWFVAVIDAVPAPQTMRLRAAVVETVMVAAHPLERGRILSDLDLRAEAREVWGPPTHAGRERAAPGWEARRALNAGDVVGMPAAMPPPLVSGGEPIRLVWERSGVRVSVTGIAINSARRGELVRARMEGRGRRLTGTAVGAGVAQLVDGGPQ